MQTYEVLEYQILYLFMYLFQFENHGNCANVRAENETSTIYWMNTLFPKIEFQDKIQLSFFVRDIPL